MHYCLGHRMRNAGHTLDWGCPFCATRCDYASPCGCGSAHCMDVRGTSAAA